jgi:hypothetical protein
MTDGTRGAANPTRINVTDPYELIYWAKILGVTREELPNLVRKAGTSTGKVPKVPGKTTT